MLLLEEKGEDYRICYFNSTNILSCKYVESKKLLAIIFFDGRQYVYENVPNYHYQRFKIAKSQGKTLKEFLHNNYKYTKYETKNDVTLLKEYINGLINTQKE
jgi:hypothetical protein